MKVDIFDTNYYKRDRNIPEPMTKQDKEELKNNIVVVSAYIISFNLVFWSFICPNWDKLKNIIFP